MAQHKLSEQSTIYHYTLLRRFTRKHPFCRVYSVGLLLWLFTDAVYLGWHGVIQLAASAVAALGAHALIVLLLLRLSKGNVPRIWGWVAAYPFFGFIPLGYVPASQWSRANRHRLLIGFSLIALLYVWLPLSWLANAAAAHYLLLLPQLVYISSFIRRYKNGLVRATSSEISLYKT